MIYLLKSSGYEESEPGEIKTLQTLNNEYIKQIKKKEKL